MRKHCLDSRVWPLNVVIRNVPIQARNSDVLSKRTFTPPGATEEVALASHSFDTGAAWGYFALQASLSGWKAHGLAGIERERIRAELAIPDDYAVEAAIAIGRPGDKSSLPEGLQKRETPSPRNPLSTLAAEGQFAF